MPGVPVANMTKSAGRVLDAGRTTDKGRGQGTQLYVWISKQDLLRGGGGGKRVAAGKNKYAKRRPFKMLKKKGSGQGCQSYTTP